MQNVNMTRKGNLVTLSFDVTKNLGPSSTGKTDLVANTGGAVIIDGSHGVKVSLIATKPRKSAF